MGRFEVTAEMVAAVYPGAEDADRVEALLPIAEERLLARVPRLAERVASGALSKVLVQGVLIDMVGRVAQHREGGYESLQASAGGMSWGGKIAPGSDQVRVLPSDLRDLMPRTSSQGRTIRARARW